jgi:ribosomal protein L32
MAVPKKKVSVARRRKLKTLTISTALKQCQLCNQPLLANRHCQKIKFGISCIPFN